MDYYNNFMHEILLDIKQFTTKEMSIKNDLIKHLQNTNKSLTDLVNFQQDVITCIMTIYRKHIIKLLALSNFNLDDKYNSKYEGTIMQQAAKIQEMVQVMQKAIALDSQEPLNHFQEMARLQKENKDLRELLNIANQFGSFYMPNDVETQTVEKITDCSVEKLKTNASENIDENSWFDPSYKGFQLSSITIRSDKMIAEQLNNEQSSLKSSETVVEQEQVDTDVEHNVKVVMSELAVNQKLASRVTTI